jgi:hypothetical protein
MIVSGEKCVAETALALGADVVPQGTPATLESLCPDVVIIDEPADARAHRWIAAARRTGALVVTVRDRDDARAASLAVERGVTRAPRGRQVLIELDRDLRLKLAAAVADAIAVAESDAEVRITGRFVVAPRSVRRSLGGGGRAALAKALVFAARSRSARAWSAERAS